MSQFDISNFTKPSPAPQGAQAKALTAREPSWVAHATPKVKASYHAVLEVYDEITEKIKDKQKLPINERKIILAQIAKKIGVDRSYLTKRRTRELYDLVHKDLNIRLQRLWKKHSTTKSGRRFSKSELEVKLTKTKRLLAEERDKNYSEAISKALRSELYGSQKKLADKCVKLQAENKELREKMENMRSQFRKDHIKGI